MRFIIFVIDSQTGTASGDEMAAIDAFNQSLRDNGHWIMAAGIQPSSSATSIDNRGDRNELVRNKSLQGTEYFSGFWIIEATDVNQAEQLALAGSKACNRKVEVRPYL